MDGEADPGEGKEPPGRSLSDPLYSEYLQFDSHLPHSLQYLQFLTLAVLFRLVTVSKMLDRVSVTLLSVSACPSYRALPSAAACIQGPGRRVSKWGSKDSSTFPLREAKISRFAPRTAAAEPVATHRSAPQPISSHPIVSGGGGGSGGHLTY